MNKNIILIGMPGSGKSTVGVILAKIAGMDFVDTDVLIQLREHRTLQDIVNTNGYLELRHIEERAILDLHVHETVIATGGSAVYGTAGMNHLKHGGLVVYLQVPLHELERRVGDYSQRGLAKHPDQSFDELFAERTALYEKFAEITIAHDACSPEEVCQRILKAILTQSRGNA